MLGSCLLLLLALLLLPTVAAARLTAPLLGAPGG